MSTQVVLVPTGPANPATGGTFWNEAGGPGNWAAGGAGGRDTSTLP